MKAMKISKIILALILTTLLLTGCDKPAPTELVADENFDDPLQVEVIAKDTANEYYSNGYDTTGVVEQLYRFSNIIALSGVKVTYKNNTYESSIAQAVFFDRNFPIYAPSGRLLGYRTHTPGDVEFDNKKARRVPLRIRYRSGNSILDTLLGFQYLLFNKNNSPGDPFTFPYNSSVNFSYKPIPGNAQTFPILTPDEVNAEIRLTGSSKDKSLAVNLTWNKTLQPEIEVVIGVIATGRRESLPLYRLKTRNDGSLKIPVNLLLKIPRNQYNRIVFTLMRRYEKRHNNNNIDLYVLSQSTHSIVADIP